MFWADKIADSIIKERKEKTHRVDDMKTPSGRVHVGSLRGVLIHDLVYKSLLSAGFKAKYTFVFNDMDPMDGLPHYLDEKKYEPYMGVPLFQIPAPDGKSKSFAHQYANEFIEAMGKLGAKPQIVWSHKIYESGKMNGVIKEALDQVKIIRQVYEGVGGYDKPDHWYPFQVICPKCGKVGTTEVYLWDGKKVSFRCKKDLVEWAEGCEYEGHISPLNGSGKLMWKVDWPAHWKAIGITVEGAGKDHSSAGGSRDMAVSILKSVYNYPNPFDIPYEWFLIEGKKMSSSKGVGTSASNFVEILSPQIGRFLFTRTHYNKQMNFNPEGMTIPDLYDEYDRCANVYWEKGSEDDFGRMYEVSQVKEDDKWQKRAFLPRFLEIAKVLQDPKQEMKKYFGEKKGSSLTFHEIEILKERETYARIWLKDYAPSDFVTTISKELPQEIKNLTKKQKELLTEVATYLTKEVKEDELQNFIYQSGKKVGLKAKETFQAIYLPLLGKTHGPKAAALILEQEIKWVKERLGEAVSYQEVRSQRSKVEKMENFKRRDLIKLDKKFLKKYENVTIGAAIIKGVKVEERSDELEKHKKEFFKELGSLTSGDINNSVYLQSYRKMYKQMGVDWHKRRPSPEALRRRIVRGQGFQSVNTVVDAYNLGVIKYQVSAGAFDYDTIQFPVVVKQASGGEKELYIGDKEATILQKGEVCYFDQVGPYNLDYNYRDAMRTLSNEETKNLWINVEGVYDIPREEVEATLNYVVETIIRFCGGKLEVKGIVKR